MKPGNPIYRLYPRIVLETCHQCFGRRVVLTIRGGKVVQEPCTQCAAKGTIVREAA